MIPQIDSWINIEGVYIALDEQKRIVGTLKRVVRVAGRVEDKERLKRHSRPPDGHPLDRAKYEALQGEVIEG